MVAGMKLRLVLMLAAMVAACGPSENGVAERIVGHRWARTVAGCGDSYVSFTKDRIDYVKDGRSLDPLPVKRIVPRGSNGAMFVIRVDAALASKTSWKDDVSDVALVFAVDGKKLRLLADGTPDTLIPVRADDARYRKYDLERCA